MAVAYVLDENLLAAMTNLLQSQKLNPNRAMTYYWLGVCHLQQPGGGNIAGAIDSFTKFLAFPQESPQDVKRRGKGACEWARRLNGTIGGIAARPDRRRGQGGAVGGLGREVGGRRGGHGGPRNAAGTRRRLWRRGRPARQDAGRRNDRGQPGRPGARGLGGI